MSRNVFDAHCFKCNTDFQALFGSIIYCPSCRSTVEGVMPITPEQNKAKTLENNQASVAEKPINTKESR